MSNTESTSAYSGVGFPGLLFITFLVLKLTGVVDWSWWWIFAPLWIPGAMVAVVFFIVFLFLLFDNE